MLYIFGNYNRVPVKIHDWLSGMTHNVMVTLTAGHEAGQRFFCVGMLDANRKES